MKTSLDHLPANKQRELERVVQIVFEEFEDAFALSTQNWKKKGRILKIVLYGSYARGNWIDEPHTAKGYKSDYDLLVIVSDKRLTDRVKYWTRVDERLIREYGITESLKTPVNFIVHTMQEVNDGLAQGRYFFMDIARDGIALYEADDSELATPKPKAPHAALDLAKEYYEEWYPSGGEFFDNYKFNLSKGRLNNAAFQLHQCTERLYTASCWSRPFTLR
ncbi:nucleotidyltransferase, partial [Novosphingobium sp. MBES04]